MDFSRRKKKRKSAVWTSVNAAECRRIRVGQRGAFILSDRLTELHLTLTCQAAVGAFADEEQTEIADQVLRKVQLRCDSLRKSEEKKTKGLISPAKAADPSTLCDPKAGPRHKALIMSRVIEHFLTLWSENRYTWLCPFPLNSVWLQKHCKSLQAAAINTTDTQFDPLIWLMFLTVCFRYCTVVNWC